MAITYTPTTNFGAKDSLPTNDPDKVIKGSEFTTEFTALQTAFSLAAPNASPTFTGTVTIPTADINGGAIDGTVIGAVTPAAASFTTVSATGNITVGGTVDGRDVAADGTKLDGIEAGADVTDTTNVTAAGALMDSELTNIAAVKALNQGVATTDSPSFAGLTATGSVSLAGASTTADITFGDNDKAIFGAGSDLQIYHDGSKSYITDAGTGNLEIQGTDIRLLDNTSGGLRYLVASNNGGNPNVSLFYNNGKVFETTATGIDVTGTVTADDLTIDGAVVVNSDTTTAITVTQNANTDVNGLMGIRINNSTGTTYAAFGNSGADSVAITAGDAGGTGNTSLTFKTAASGAEKSRLNIGSGGDISFYEDTGTTPKFFWDASAESLGIGTSSLTSNASLSIAQGGVHVDGGASGGASQVILSTGASSGSNFGQISNTGTRWSLGYGGTQQTVGTEVLTWNSSGNVGIGTTSPARPLTVNGLIGSRNSTTGFGTSDGFDIGVGGSDAYLVQRENADIIIEANGAERMRITSTGSVGIGTNSPSATLDVENSAVGTIAEFRSNTANGQKLQLNSTSTGVQIASGFDTGISGSFDIRSGGGNSYITMSPTGSEAMRLDSSGNWMLGTTDSNLFTSSTENGLYVTSTGQIRSSVNSVAAYLNRTGSDGDIAVFRKDGTTVGSIGTSGGALYIGDGDTNLVFDPGNDRLIPRGAAGGGRPGAIDLGGSGNEFKDLYLSGGVYLGGTGAANLLDDYEEGNFTPVIQGATTAGTFTYGTQSGIYTKIGNAVHVYVAINVTATSVSPVGSVTIQGLPFTVSGSFQSLAVGWASGITFADQLNAYVPNSETFVVLRNSVSGGNGNQIAGSNLSSSFWIFVSGTYRA